MLKKLVNNIYDTFEFFYQIYKHYNKIYNPKLYELDNREIEAMLLIKTKKEIAKYLRFNNGYKIKEIAKLLHCSERTIYNYLKRETK